MSKAERFSARVLPPSLSNAAAKSDCGTSSASDSVVPVDSSILSETLSNIDFNDFLGLETDSSSVSISTPMVPWNMRAGTRNEGGNTLVTQAYSLADNSPRLNHLELRSGRGARRKRRQGNSSPGQAAVAKGKGKRAAHKPSPKGTAGIPMSRDFFLLVALCIGLACALVCLARPVIASMFESIIYLV
ncbi:hypothetical protein AX14_002544 [Amanita brunnescens Koide BX004]|nr:hypothetical protein AX14_002544 [Amanita brunnescens Koide BX004]